MYLHLPDGSQYKVISSSSYEDKLKITNEIIDEYSDYLNDNWLQETIINGQPIYITKKLLNELGYLLAYSEENSKNGILSKAKKNKIKKKEYSLEKYIEIEEDKNDININSQSNRNKFQFSSPKHGCRFFNKNQRRFVHLKNLPDKLIEDVRINTKLHFEKCADILKKLTDIDKSSCLTVRRSLIEENNNYINVVIEFYKGILYKYYNFSYDFEIPIKNLKQKNKLLNFCKLDFMKLITRFEKIELIRKFLINNSISYSAKWEVVDTDCNFINDGVYYKIMGGYNFDKILVYKQGDKFFWFDGDIKRIRNVEIVE